MLKEFSWSRKFGLWMLFLPSAPIYRKLRLLMKISSFFLHKTTKFIFHEIRHLTAMNCIGFGSFIKKRNKTQIEKLIYHSLASNQLIRSCNCHTKFLTFIWFALLNELNSIDCAVIKHTNH